MKSVPTISGENLDFRFRRAHLLYVLLVVYAIFSSPMPNQIGAEIVIIAALLIYYSDPLKILNFRRFLNPSEVDYKKFRISSAISFFYFASIPLVVAVYKSNLAVDVVRDYIPLLFFYIPFLFHHRVNDYSESDFRRLCFFISLVGVIMAVRFLSLAVTDVAAIGMEHMGFDGFLVLSAEPSILFALIYLPMASHRFISENGLGFRSVVIFLIGISGALICFSAFGAKVARGPVGLTALAYMAYILLSVKKNGVFSNLFFLFGFVAAGFVFSDQLIGIFDLLMDKQERVGASGKDFEIVSAINVLGASYSSALFGGGWGALFEVRYSTLFSFTHSIFTYFPIKSGLIGLIMLVVYLSGFLPSLKVLWRKSRPEFFAISVSLFYPFFFQPTYKAMTIGLIMFVLVVGGRVCSYHSSEESLR